MLFLPKSRRTIIVHFYTYLLKCIEVFKKIQIFSIFGILPIRTSICANTIADFDSGGTLRCLSMGHLDLARNVFELFGKMMPFAGNSKLGHDFSFPRVRFSAPNCSLVEIIFVSNSWTSLAKTGTYNYTNKLAYIFIVILVWREK